MAETKKSNKGLIIGIAAGAAAVVVAVVVILIIVLSGGGKLSAGTYKLVSMKEGDTTFNEEDIEKYDLSGTLELKDDGTGVHKNSEEEQSFKWDKDKKTITVADETYNVKVDGNKITVDYGDVSETYIKQ